MNDNPAIYPLQENQIVAYLSSDFRKRLEKEKEKTDGELTTRSDRKRNHPYARMAEGRMFGVER